MSTTSQAQSQDKNHEELEERAKPFYRFKDGLQKVYRGLERDAEDSEKVIEFIRSSVLSRVGMNLTREERTILIREMTYQLGIHEPRGESWETYTPPHFKLLGLPKHKTIAHKRVKRARKAVRQ